MRYNCSTSPTPHPTVYLIMVLLVAKSPQVIGTVYQASIGVQSEQIRDSGIVYDRVLLRLNVISDKYGNARCESDRLLGIEIANMAVQ